GNPDGDHLGDGFDVRLVDVVGHLPGGPVVEVGDPGEDLDGDVEPVGEVLVELVDPLERLVVDLAADVDPVDLVEVLVGAAEHERRHGGGAVVVLDRGDERVAERPLEGGEFVVAAAGGVRVGAGGVRVVLGKRPLPAGRVELRGDGDDAGVGGGLGDG